MRAETFHGTLAYVINLIADGIFCLVHTAFQNLFQPCFNLGFEIFQPRNRHQKYVKLKFWHMESILLPGQVLF